MTPEEQARYEVAIKAQKDRYAELTVNLKSKRKPTVVLTEGEFNFRDRIYVFWYEEDLRDLDEHTNIERLHEGRKIEWGSQEWDDTDDEADEAIRDWLGDL